MKIVDSDAFLDMPMSTQCLYFHLNMRADDDGFIDNAKRVMKIVGAGEDDLKLLIAKRFILGFGDGVMVIKHWRMHNTLSKSRYHPTQYTDEKQMLKVKENGAYTLSDNGVAVDDTKLVEMFDDNQEETEKVSYADEIKEIIEYLNLVCGTNYKKGTSKTRKCITARLNEGFSVDDFKTVIDKKNKEWANSDMEKFLRPETLFGTKFEGYLNQKNKVAGKKKNDLFEQLKNI